MGTTGFTRAADVDYRRGEVILEVGSGDSTRFLATLGPPVVTIDVDRRAYLAALAVANVEARYGHAEDVLRGWNRPIGFAWLDGFDWPYTGNPPNYYADQRAAYENRGDTYSQDVSRASHLAVARLIAPHARVVAFDDTWRTHPFRSTGDRCDAAVPPATTPAPTLAMDTPIYRDVCGLEEDHPHHDDPLRGWNGKGGTAIPYLRGFGFDVVDYGLGQVLLRRGESDR